MRQWIIALVIITGNLTAQASIDSLKNLSKQSKVDTTKGNLYLEIALSYYNNDGMLDSSLAYFQKALGIFKHKKYFTKTSQSYSGLGLIYREKGIYNKALENYLKAHEFAVKANDQKRMAKALTGIGVVHAIQGDTKKALYYYKEAEKINIALDNKQGLASCYNNIGLLYSDGEHFQKAIFYFRKSLKIDEEIDDQRGIATVNENIGLIFLNQLNDVDNALANFSKSVSIWRNMGDRFSVSITLQYMASALNRAKRYKSSIDTSLLALNLAIETKSLSSQMASHNELAIAYEKTGDVNNAYKHYKQFIQLKDSLKNDEKIREITSLQLNYDFDKQRSVDSLSKAMEANQHRFELSKQREFSYWLLTGLSLMLLLTAFLYIVYQKNRKAKKEISMQKLVIEHRNMEVMDSIKYASRIQNAILPPEELMKKALNDHFVLYLPKDIVSGDFYWVEEKNDLVYFAVVDCTGHGVPGAFISIVGRNGLNDAVNIANLTSAAEILNFLNKYVNETLHQRFEQSNIRDGMDMSLCILNKKTNTLEFAGANNPIWISRNNNSEMIEDAGDKQPIGNFIGTDKEKPFKQQTVNIAKGDILYLFSDGFADQFGGPKGKKFKYKRLKEALLTIRNEKPEQQKHILENMFASWRGDLEQIDDVCVVGIKL